MATTSNKRKKAVAATVAAAAILLAGTFAWTSISQTALNEAIVDINPGGRLHDDFNGTNKDVYVENFNTDVDAVPIFARVKLTEYVELGPEAGDKSKTDAERNAQSWPEGNLALDVEPDTWQTYIPGDDGTLFNKENVSDEYWTLQWGNGADNMPYYLPTFNKNKDSLEADINGTYEGTVEGDIVHYDDYILYDENSTAVEGTEVVDWDEDTDDEGDAAVPVTDPDKNPFGTEPYDIKETPNVTHNIAQIETEAIVITMQEWIDDYYMEPGPYWVYDTDGWAYWAQPIEPGTTTGLFLDGIQMHKTPDENWYYGLNVIGEFATWADIDKFNGSPNGGTTGEADELLRIITGQNDDQNSEQTLELWHVDADDWGYIEAALDESFKVTVNEESLPEGVTYDLDEVIVYMDIYDEETEEWNWEPIDSSMYEYADGKLTITDPALDGQYLRVSDKNDVIHGFVDISSGGDDGGSDFYEEIHIYNDEFADTVSGGEWLIFDADVYDENGDVIATTDEVAFTVREVRGNEDEEGGAAAASLDIEETYMDGNDLFVASDILDTDVTALIVTASYGEDYVDTYRLEVTGRENPLAITLSIEGQNIAPYLGSVNGYQLFRPRPAAHTYDFGASLDGATAPVTWTIGEDQDEDFTVSGPDEDGYVYAVATENYDFGWKPVEAGTKLAKIHQTSGEFNFLLEDELYPLSMPFDLVATMEDGSSNSTNLFVRRTEVNMHLTDKNNEDGAINHGGVYTAGEGATFELEADIITLTEEGEEITYKGEDVADKLTNWKMYGSEDMYPEYDDNNLLNEGYYTVTNNNDGTWTLTIDENVTYNYVTLQAEYQHWRKVPGDILAETEGLFTVGFSITESALAESNTGDIADMAIVNEYDETYSIYAPGERSKIKLRALATDENGEEAWPSGTMQWYMEDRNGNKEISNTTLVTDGFEASVWILGDSAEEIRVTGVYFADDGDGSAEMERHFYIYKEGHEPEEPEEW